MGCAEYADLVWDMSTSCGKSDPMNNEWSAEQFNEDDGQSFEVRGTSPGKCEPRKKAPQVKSPPASG